MTYIVSIFRKSLLSHVVVSVRIYLQRNVDTTGSAPVS